MCTVVPLCVTGDLSRVDPCLLPRESWDRLEQIPVNLNWIKQVWIMDGWMDGWMDANNVDTALVGVHKELGEEVNVIHGWETDCYSPPDRR